MLSWFNTQIYRQMKKQATNQLPAFTQGKWAKLRTARIVQTNTRGSFLAAGRWGTSGNPREVSQARFYGNKSQTTRHTFVLVTPSHPVCVLSGQQPPVSPLQRAATRLSLTYYYNALSVFPL